MQPKPDPAAEAASDELPQQRPETQYHPECGTPIEQWIREQLQLGDEAVARGEIVPFDPAAIKAAGRRRLNKPS